jgi:hypothetical protein
MHCVQWLKWNLGSVEQGCFLPICKKGYLYNYSISSDIFEGRLCGLVDRVPDYRSRGPGSIPDTIRFSEK